VVPSWQASAIIGDLDPKCLLRAFEADRAPVGMGMMGHVGKGFLHDAIGGDLDGGRERG
jgi:hypothetical protein